MKYFLSLFLIINIGFLFAQKTPKENIGGMKSNALYVSGTLEGELWFFYERIIAKRHAIEIGYGKKWGSSIESSLSNKTDQAQFYAGRIFMGSYKWYFHSGKHPYYLSALIFYKNFSFPPLEIDHYYSHDESGDCQIRSSNKQVYGLKILVGKRFNFKVTNKVAFIVDVYSGIGIRTKNFKDLVYAHDSGGIGIPLYCTPYPTPVNDNSNVIVPSIHLGAKIGFGL